MPAPDVQREGDVTSESDIRGVCLSFPYGLLCGVILQFLCRNSVISL